MKGAAMVEDPIITRMNVAHYETLLALPLDDTRRSAIECLLAQARHALESPRETEAAAIRAMAEGLRSASQLCRATAAEISAPNLKRRLASAAFDIAQIAEILAIKIELKP